MRLHVVLTIINYDVFGTNKDKIISCCLVSKRMKDINVNMIDILNVIGHSIKVLSQIISGEFMHSTLQTKIHLLVLKLSFVLIVGSLLYNVIIFLRFKTDICPIIRTNTIITIHDPAAINRNLKLYFILRYKNVSVNIVRNWIFYILLDRKCTINVIWSLTIIIILEFYIKLCILMYLREKINRMLALQSPYNESTSRVIPRSNDRPTTVEGGSNQGAIATYDHNAAKEYCKYYSWRIKVAIKYQCNGFILDRISFVYNFDCNVYHFSHQIKQQFYQCQSKI